MFPRVAYATYRGDLPDPDLPLALSALRDVRLEAQAVVWDEPVDWSDFDLVVVRSTWDYVGRRPEFLRWARAVEDVTRLANPTRCLARNSDKTYLRDFGRQDIPTIPTVWLEPGDDEATALAQVEGFGWDRMVVKPNVDGGGFNAALVDDASEAATLAVEWTGRGLVALIQPYLSVVERSAELSVVVLGGEISHAVTRRAPLTNAGDSSVDMRVPVPHGVADLVADVMRAGSDDEELLYARVDLVPQDDAWLVMEFEAVEPRLFLDADPQAPGRLAAAVRRMLRES